jgi:hypothetical protein
MKKKCLDPADLRRLAEGRVRATGKPSLSDAIVACAIMELLGPAYAYVRHACLGDVIEGVRSPESDVVVSLCVFAQDGSTWSPALIIDHVAHVDAPPVLESLGVPHVIVTSEQMAAGYIRTPQFRDTLTRALAGHTSTESDTEEFQSERRPIYPPRRGVAGD